MPQLVSPLQAILDAELAVGNTIWEVSAWPPTCELFIMLQRKFSQAYRLTPGVTHRLINDAHYWHAEYDFNTGQQTLACGFT